MPRKSPTLILISALVCFLWAVTPALPDTAAGKAGIVRQLSPCAPSILPQRAALARAQYREAAPQVELDLVAYRWIAKQFAQQTDIRNLDLIINALQKPLNDRFIDWAIPQFPTTNGATPYDSSPPDSDAERAQNLLDLKEQVKTAVDEKDRSPARAVDALEKAARVCQKLSLSLTEAVISKEIADHYQYDMARYRQAELFYDRASNTFQTYRCASAAANTQHDWALLYTAIGKFASAADHYIQAARQWEEMAAKDPSRYKFRDRAGMEYMRAGKAKEAAGTDYASALDLMAGHGLPHLRNWAIATKSYDVLVTNQLTIAASMREHSQDPAKVLALLTEAQEAAALYGNPLLTARVYGELAKAYEAAGKAENAQSANTKRIKSLWKAATDGEAALQKLAKPPTAQTASALLTMAERGAAAYQELDRLAPSSKAWRDTAQAYGRAGLYEDEIRCIRAAATVLDAEKKPTEALDARMEAVSIARRIERNALAAEIVVSIIQQFRDMKDPLNALEGFKELEPILVRAGNSRQIADALAARGALQMTLEQPSEAIRDFLAAREKYLALVGDVWAAGDVSLQLAQAERAQQQPDQVISTLAAALNAIEETYNFESLQSSAYRDHSRIATDLYSELASAYIRADKEQDAVETIRRAWRYPWLSDLMGKLSASADKKVSDFAKTHSMLSDGHDNTPATELKLVADNAGEFAKACLKLRQNYATAYGLLPVDPLVLYKFQNMLPRDTAVIGYIATESSIYTWVCSREKTILRQVERAGSDVAVRDLRKAIEDCEQSLSTGVPVPEVVDWQSTGFQEIREPLTALYAKLLKPVEDDIRGHRHLVFVLPNELASLPMQALICGDQGGAPVFLVQNYEISYLTHGTLDDLVGTQNREIYPSLDRLAIFADPEDNLPGSRKEADVIRKAYPTSKTYVGNSEATASSFLRECGQAGIVHIAAHHKIDITPGDFELLLAPDGASDGFVGLQQLLQVENPSLQLVVLSACDTVGSSDPVSSGPAQAVELFSLAGAKSVLGGLWKISDEAASQIFASFYANLSKGRSRSEALRLAQLSVIESKQFAHPFYWACFALYGNPR